MKRLARKLVKDKWTDPSVLAVFLSEYLGIPVSASDLKDPDTERLRDAAIEALAKDLKIPDPSVRDRANYYIKRFSDEA